MPDHYRVSDYGQVVADPVRMAACARAIGQRVKPGGVVVDLGAGVGLFALLARQSGARIVFSIEPADAVRPVPIRRNTQCPLCGDAPTITTLALQEAPVCNLSSELQAVGA